MNIVNSIKYVRNDKKLTQQDMANRLGVERSNYSYLENRGKLLSIEQLEQIAAAMGVTIKDILFAEKSTPDEVRIVSLEREVELLKKEIQLGEKQKEQFAEMEQVEKEMRQLLSHLLQTLPAATLQDLKENLQKIVQTTSTSSSNHREVTLLRLLNMLDEAKS